MKYFNALCIFLIFALAAKYTAAAELDGAESSVAAKSPEKRGIYGFGYGHGIGYGGVYGGHGYYGGLGLGHAFPSYAAVHSAPYIGHGHGYYPYHGHGFYH